MNLIPKNTKLRAKIESAGWDNNGKDDYFIIIKWRISEPGEHHGKIIRQKLHIEDIDPEKKKRALKMLATINTICGAPLQLHEWRNPNEIELHKALSGKEMTIKIGVWEINEKTGNYIVGVSK
jgi:hypothetical protein